ncbi:MAG: class I SAM-dependent methyltransferase [Actinomycetota bacterium]
MQRSRLYEVLQALVGRLRAPIQRGLVAGARRLPPAMRGRIWEATGKDRPPGTVRWGDLRRISPIARDWGYGRGQPIDRVYIEHFLSSCASDIHGACLEVLNADYTERFGGARVSRKDVLDINPANTSATLVADLNEMDSLPSQRFDCIILTQTLHLIPDMRIALMNVWRALQPGGVLLVTVPALGRHDSRPGFDHDRWRLTPSGLGSLLGELPDTRTSIVTYGNVLSCSAFLYGLAASELRAEELRVLDPEFPLIVAGHARRVEAPP